MILIKEIFNLITFPRFIMCVSGIGVIFLNFMARREGFLFFALSALLWMIYDIRIGAYEQAGVMFVSALTSLIGYYRWARKEKGK